MEALDITPVIYALVGSVVIPVLVDWIGVLKGDGSAFKAQVAIVLAAVVSALSEALAGSGGFDVRQAIATFALALVGTQGSYTMIHQTALKRASLPRERAAKLNGRAG